MAPVESAAALADAIRRIGVETQGREPAGIDHDHADEELGTISSDDAIGFDPVPLLRVLDRHGATVVIIGQVAGLRSMTSRPKDVRRVEELQRLHPGLA